MKRKNNSPPAPERKELERQLETLQHDIQKLQLEHDLLKKANEILKKDLGVDLQLLSNREKTLLVDALKGLINSLICLLSWDWRAAHIFTIELA